MQNLRNYITKVMLRFGFRNSLAGFYYFREAVIAVMTKPPTNITVMYKKIGKQFGMQASQVERSIRHTVELIPDLSRAIDALFEIHVPFDGHTNKDMIYLFAQYVSMNYDRPIYIDKNSSPFQTIAPNISYEKLITTPPPDEEYEPLSRAKAANDEQNGDEGYIQDGTNNQKIAELKQRFNAALYDADSDVAAAQDAPAPSARKSASKPLSDDFLEWVKSKN